MNILRKLWFFVFFNAMVKDRHQGEINLEILHGGKLKKTKYT